MALLYGPAVGIPVGLKGVPSANSVPPDATHGSHDHPWSHGPQAFPDAIALDTSKRELRIVGCR
eukprot:3751211-Alexandrium_andersonii.AAC.1